MKWILSIMVVLSLLVSPVFAEETEKKSFWDTLRSKIEKVTPSKKASVTTAVGGVRGAQSDSGGNLYWKDKQEMVEVSDAELSQFSQALELATAGEVEKAISQFEAFLVQFPQSILREDTIMALDRLRVGASLDASEDSAKAES